MGVGLSIPAYEAENIHVLNTDDRYKTVSLFEFVTIAKTADQLLKAEVFVQDLCA